MKNPVQSGFFEDRNLGISRSKSYSIINIFSGNYSVRMPSSGEKNTHIGETKRVQSVSHPHTRPVSMSNTVGCLRSGTVSHAVTRRPIQQK